MRSAATFDFYNTLVACDSWFQLEIAHLPSAFLGWWSGSDVSAARTSAVDAAYRRLRSAIVAHGHELPAERCLAVVLARAGIDVDDATIARGVHDLMAGSLESARPVAGAIDTVRSLHAAGLALGVVSNAVYHPFLEWAIERFGLAGCFDVVASSAVSGYYKSRPEIYLETLEALESAPARSVHIGDSARFDVESAVRTGMRTVWLRVKGAQPPRVDPDLTLDTLEGSAGEILKILAGQEL